MKGLWLAVVAGLGMTGVVGLLTLQSRLGIMESIGLAGVVVAAVAMVAQPVWGLCLAVLLDLYFSYVQALGLPPRNYVIAFLAFPAAIRVLYGGVVPVPASAYRFAGAVLLITSWAFVRGLGLAPDLVNASYEFAKTLGVPILICLVTSSILTKERDIRRFLQFVTGCLALSSLVAVLQMFGVEEAWQLRESLGLEAEGSVSHQIRGRERVTGLTYFAIQLAYQLVTVLPIAMSVWLIGKGAPRARLIPLVAVGALVAGLGATLARSGIAGAMIGVAVVVWLSGRRGRVRWLLGMMTVMIVLVGAVDLAERRGLGVEDLTYGRLPLFVAGTLVALDHPLGIGPQGHFNEYAANYYSEVSDLPGAHFVMERAAHNQFLNVLVALGFLGLLGLIWFYVELFRLLGRIRRSPNLSPFLRSVAIGLTGSFVGYQVNAFFHNPGPFTGDPFNWYWVGMVLVLARLAGRSGEGDLRQTRPVEAMSHARRPEHSRT